MIILDTNVVSEIMQANANADVLTWFDAIPNPSLFTTAVSRAEILFGIALLPNGKRREALANAAISAFAIHFRDRVLPFDGPSADAYAELASRRRRAGRPIGQFDGQIAAIALASGAELATRNTADFIDTGITLINPWKIPYAL